MTASPDEARPDLAARIRRGQLVTGLVVKMPSPAVVEAAGHAGLHVVVIDTEHGIGDMHELEHHIRAADSASIPVIVRVGANDPLAILRSLDAGATGIIVPHINSKTEATAAVRAAHYPPDGTRGLATSTRAGRHSFASLDEHIAKSRSETVVIAQIEDKNAIPAAAEIASTPGIDAVWLGPSDLSMSLGRPGEFDHPEVANAINSIVDGVNTSDSSRLCVLVEDESDVTAWRARGASIALFAASAILSGRLRQIAALADSPVIG